MNVTHVHLCLVIVFFLLPVFKDVNTPSPFIEKFPDVEGEGAKAALPDHIYLDSMGFGMGMCCLQVHVPCATRKCNTLLNLTLAVDFKRRQKRHDRYECSSNAFGKMTLKGIQALNGIRIHGLCATSAMVSQLSC